MSSANKLAIMINSTEEVTGDGRLIAPVEYQTALDALGRRLHARVGRAGNEIVNHPAELRLLRDLDRDGLTSFAHTHGLDIVMRGHGICYEFTHRAVRS